MTEEVVKYLEDISKEDLIRDWEEIQNKRIEDEKKENDKPINDLWSWYTFLKHLSHDDSFALELHSYAFRVCSEYYEDKGKEPELEYVKEEVKKEFSLKENKQYLKEYGFKSVKDIDWKKYKM